MTRVGLSAVTAACLLAGCGGGERSQHRAGANTQCATGTPSPISVRSLIRTFALYGFVMGRFGVCTDPSAVAGVANLDLGLPESRQAAIVRRHGSILCQLFRTSRSKRLRILTYGHGTVVDVFDVLNVDCAVYPSTPRRAREQDRAVERVMRVIAAGS